MISIARIKGRSMLPTYKDGQLVLIKELKTMHDKYQVCAGDVILIKRKGTDYHVIKRVTSLPQENGRRRVYVCGDNPVISIDSRSYGCIDFEDIVGEVIFPKRAKRTV